MADRFNRMQRVMERMEFLMNANPLLTSTLQENFYRSLLDDLHKLSCAFLDEKHWMEAGNFLTHSLIVYDCVKNAGFRRRDDSTKEENTFLLRAACGMKLGAFDIAQKDASEVLRGDPDNRYAQEIKVLADSEILLKEHYKGHFVRPKLEKCRAEMEKMTRSGKPFQWDRPHYEAIKAKLDSILGPRQAPGTQRSWASMVNNNNSWSKAGTPEPRQVDEAWLPKQGLPKQAQPQKPSAKKKGRSRRQNRRRKESEVNYYEDSDDDDDDETETESEIETETSSSHSSNTSPEKVSDVAGLDDFGLTSPIHHKQEKAAKNLSGLDDFDDFGFMTPGRKKGKNKGLQPQQSNQTARSGMINGAIPKATQQKQHQQQHQQQLHQQQLQQQRQQQQQVMSQPPQPVARPPPPPISAETRQWLAGHDFRLACQMCFTQMPDQHGLYAYRLEQDASHKPQCTCLMLVCKLTYVPPKKGLEEVFGRIRRRPKPEFMGRYHLCQQFESGIPCKISVESCWFPHSNVELDVWEADRNGCFNGQEVVQYLRYKHNLELAEMKRNRQALAQAKMAVSANHSTHLPNQQQQQQQQQQQKAHSSVPKATSPPSGVNHGPNITSGSGAFPQLPKAAQPPGAYPSTAQNLTARKATQAPGAYPGNSGAQGAYPQANAASNVQNGFSQPPSVTRSETPLLPSPIQTATPIQVQNTQSAVNVSGPQREKILNLIRSLGGQFLYLCRFCFDDIPQVLSVQSSSNPGKCTGENSHVWNGPSRCLVHRLCQNGRDRYWKVRKRPNGIPPKAFLCWHRNKSYGCPIGTKCSFAHNEVEVCVWLFEAHNPLNRELLVRLNHELIYGPSVPTVQTSAKSAAVAPVQPVVPQEPRRPVFPQKIKIVCSLCYSRTGQQVEQHPRKPTQCAGNNSHEWGKYPMYFMFSTATGRSVRVVSRHSRLRPEIDPKLCWRGETCRYRESNQCMFPHSEEEVLLWIYQAKAKVKTIEEVVAIQREAAAAKKGNYQPGPAGDAGAAQHPQVPQQMVSSYYHCSYCDLPFRTKQSYDRHVGSMEHKMRIKSDTERSWKYRSPPLNVTNGQYKLCQKNLKKNCDYTGVVQERNDCPLAHSEEELEEWKERHAYRMMKIVKAKEQKLYSFVDELLAEYNQSSNAEYDVMTEEIAGISVKCLQNLKAIVPIKDRTHDEIIKHEWEFEITSARRSLRRVGLLYDEHRLHFYLSQPKNEERPQVCPGGLLAELGSTSYKIKIQFETHILGLFHQWVVFDFGEKPVLVRKISVHIGSSTDIERYAKHQQTREKIKLWDSGNSHIVKFSSPNVRPELHEFEKKLIADYKQPTTLSGLEDEDADRRMNEENYKLHMHRMLYLEEIECMERLARYSTPTEMIVTNQVKRSRDQGPTYSTHGELFGTIKLEIPLYDDSEASQIVQQRVEKVLIKFNQESDVVYEAYIPRGMGEPQSVDSVCVHLSAKCVQEQNLASFLNFSTDTSKKPKAVPIIVQFQFNRLLFVYQHHAIDNLNCMTVVFPPYPQHDRFEFVSWQEVKNREEAVNPRQEKAARYIAKAGGLRGDSRSRGKGPVIIFGPFGTGKTYTMALAVKRTMLTRPDSRILICTRSNSAADLYITEYLDKFCREFPGLVYMVRMYATSRQTNFIDEAVLRYTLHRDDGSFRHPFDAELDDWASYAKTQRDERRRTPNIVIATLHTAVHLTRNNRLKEYFTHIIIDEAGQVLETEAIIPLQLATNDTCVVLAGDHKQINPKVYSGRARSAQFHVSMLKRLFTYSRDHRCNFTLLLTYNYRTCHQILDFLAERYYKTKMEARGHHPPHPMFYPLNFYVVKGEDRLVGTSYINNEEVLEAAFRVEDLYRNWPPEWGPVSEDSIAVLTPYHLQAHHIRRELQRRGLAIITVDTVQNVQGKQFQAVVISTVRTRQTVNKAQITAIPQGTGNQQENEFYYAFLSDERLLNTAFSRAKSLLMVVGDPVALLSVGACHMTWMRYMQECEKHKSIIPPDTTCEMIQEEITAAKQRLNPTATHNNSRKAAMSPAQQKGSVSPSKAAAASARFAGNSIWGNTPWKQQQQQQHLGAVAPSLAYQRLNSAEFPELPESVQVPQNGGNNNGHPNGTNSDSDEEDEFEDLVTNIQDDDLLEELRLQVKVDYQEEMGGGHDSRESTEEDTQDSDSESPPELTPPRVVRRDEPLPELSTKNVEEFEAQTIRVTSAPPAAQKQEQPRMKEQLPQSKTSEPLASMTPEPNIMLKNEGVPQFRMVEREGRIALLPRNMPVRALSQVEDYDSDEDEASCFPEEQTETDFLEKIVTEPEKYKVCTFRYDTKGATYAIPAHRKANEIISITSKKRRGQALDNDEVIVEIIENTEHPEEVEGQEGEEEDKVYGRVVYIVKRDSEPYLRKIVCTLDPFSGNLMVPVDRTFPTLFITKTEDKSEEARGRNLVKVTIHTISREAAKTQGTFKPERDVYVDNKERPHKLFVVRFWKWYPKTPYPLGVVVEELDPGVNPRQGLHILKLIHNIKDKFKVSVDEYLQMHFPPGWAVPKAILDQRVDYRDQNIFTIDPPDSEDLDDALSIKTVGQNLYEVGIHIADVSFFIPKGSDLDEEARVRATSFYPAFHEKPTHMLPKRLSTDLCSLLPHVDKLALSLVVILDGNGNLVQPPNVFRTVVRSRKKLSYHQVEKVIQGECPEDLTDVADSILNLHKLASKRRAARLGQRAYVFNAEDDDGEVQDPLAHSLIEEFMILANNIIADHLLVQYAGCTPLRRQLAPSIDKVEEWKKHHKDGVRNSLWLSAAAGQQEVDVEEENEPVVPLTKAVWEEVVQAASDNNERNLEKLANLICLDENHPVQSVAQAQFYRIMERAEYVNSGDHRDPEKKSHFSLHLKAYTHFTSPIRRFIDLVVHRMLIASLEGSPCPYEERELANITHYCTSRAIHSQRFSNESKSLLLALKLQEAPLQLLSFVESYSDSSLKLLIPHRSYIQPRQCNIKFRILKPYKMPETTALSESIDMTWKSRIYDVHLEGQQKQGHRKKPMALDTGRHIIHIPEDNWEDIQKSVQLGDFGEVKRAIQSAIQAGGPELRQYADVMRQFSDQRSTVEVTCEYVDMTGKQQIFIDFSRSFKRGDVNIVQMHARLSKGVLTPHIQLLNMTPQLDVCAEHRDNPVVTFSDVATKIPGKERSIAAYQKTWLPIISMICAHSAVQSDDTIIIHGVSITWQKIDGGRYQGYFNLALPFIQQRSIRFFFPKQEKDKKQHVEEEDDVQLDFLCIRYKSLSINPRRHLNMRGLDTRSKQQEAIGPYNRHAWAEQTFVAHGHTTSVQRDDKAQLLTITFQLHSTSLPFPEDALLYQHDGKQKSCTIELIPKTMPERRLEDAVRKLPDTTPLIRNICLRKPCKPDDSVFSNDEVTKVALKEGAKMKDLRVQETGLNPLNKSQQEAVRMALRNIFALIQGPPGTGKTVTGAYLAYFFTQINKKVPAMGKGTPQVLYCGPSNKAVDVIASYLKKFDISIVRVYSEMMEGKVYPIPGMPSIESKWKRSNEARVDDRLDDVALHKLIRRPGARFAAEIRAMELYFDGIETASTGEIKKYKELISEAEAEELKKHAVVLCTCNAAGADRIHKHTNIIQCIVDEAGMCNEPETLIPLTNTLPHQIVLIGDHKQLRPIITESNARDLGMEESLLEKYQKKALMLTTQYRMHESICSFPSEAFYDNRLETDHSVRMRSPDPLRAIWPNRGQTPTVFCHVYGKEETLTVKSDEGNEMSKANLAEVQHATRIVTQLLRKGARASDIVVLSQYKLQCSHVEERLKTMGHRAVKVSTVVTSQGSEWDYVILSLVRSMPQIEIDDKPSRGWRRKHLGFITDENQMNVALTRARRGLIIIGNQYLLDTHPKWKELLRKYRENNCVMEAHRFPPFGS